MKRNREEDEIENFTKDNFGRDQKMNDHNDQKEVRDSHPLDYKDAAGYFLVIV